MCLRQRFGPRGSGHGRRRAWRATGRRCGRDPRRSRREKPGASGLEKIHRRSAQACRNGQQPREKDGPSARKLMARGATPSTCARTFDTVSTGGLVSASRGDELLEPWTEVRFFTSLGASAKGSSRRRDAFANARDERATRKSVTIVSRRDRATCRALLPHSGWASSAWIHSRCPNASSASSCRQRAGA